MLKPYHKYVTFWEVKSLPKWIGVLHLEPLPGSPGSRGFSPVESVNRAGERAVREAKQLVQAGFEGLIIENFGDSPFFKDSVPPETVAAMAMITAAVRESVKVPVGVNVLRNDVRSALSIAATTGAEFVRANIWSGVAATDQGWVEGRAAELLRERDRLGAPTLVFADVWVKHAQTYSSADLISAIEDTFYRGKAHALIVTGSGTGKPVNAEHLEWADRVCDHMGCPLYVGSGVDVKNISQIKSKAYGLIIGSAFRKGGYAGAPIDSKNLSQLVSALKSKAKRKK